MPSVLLKNYAGRHLHHLLVRPYWNAPFIILIYSCWTLTENSVHVSISWTTNAVTFVSQQMLKYMPLDIIFMTLQIPIRHHQAPSNFRRENLVLVPRFSLLLRRDYRKERTLGTKLGKSPGSEVAVSSGNYNYLKLPTYPSPKPTLTLTSHLGQNVGLREG